MWLNIAGDENDSAHIHSAFRLGISAAMSELEYHLGLAAAVDLCGLQVVQEGSLRTGTGLGDQVTELVLVMGDAAVKSVVLPVTVEDVAGVKLVMEEGKLLEQLLPAPAGDLLTWCKLADVDATKIGAGLEDVGKQFAILT